MRKEAVLVSLIISSAFITSSIFYFSVHKIFDHSVFAKVQEYKTKILFGSMKGWPTGTKISIWDGFLVKEEQGWWWYTRDYQVEADLFFNISVEISNIKSASINLYLYALTAGYAQAYIYTLQINGYIVVNNFKFVPYSSWFSTKYERLEWLRWDIPNYYLKKEENHIFLCMYFKDIVDDRKRDFEIYDISYVEVTISDITPPNTTVYLSGNQIKEGLFTQNVLVSFQSEDSISGVNSTYYKVDQQNWARYLCPFLVTGDGRHIIRYYSIDNAGNKEAEKSIYFEIDANPPSIVEIYPSNNSYINLSSFTLTWKANDYIGIDRFVLYLDGSLLGSTNSMEWKFENLQEGEHIIGIVAYDLVGHSKTFVYTVTIDYSCPNLLIISPANGTSIFGNVSIEAIAYDRISGIKRLEICISDLRANMTFIRNVWKYALDTSMLPGGVNIIKVVAFDNAENYNMTEFCLIVKKLQIQIVDFNPIIVDGERSKIVLHVSDQDGKNVEEAQVSLIIYGKSFTYSEVGCGFYEALIDTSGMLTPVDIVGRSYPLHIHAHKYGYNPDAKILTLTIQRTILSMIFLLIAYATGPIATIVAVCRYAYEKKLEKYDIYITRVAEKYRRPLSAAVLVYELNDPNFSLKDARKALNRFVKNKQGKKWIDLDGTEYVGIPSIWKDLPLLENKILKIILDEGRPINRAKLRIMSGLPESAFNKVIINLEREGYIIYDIATDQYRLRGANTI